MITHNFKALLVLIFITILACESSTLVFKPSKGKNRWVSNPSSPASNSPLLPANNKPWYSDFTDNFACEGNVASISYMEQDGLNKTLIDLFMKGGINTAVCLNITLTNGSNFLTKFKIASLSNIYDFDFQEHCGSPVAIKPWLNDKNKPSITNGVSCHCPGSPFNAQFTPCPYDVLDNNTYSYDRRMPVGQITQEVRMCHNLNARGTSKGCTSGNKVTDHFLKFESIWNMTPVFQMKRREIQELVFLAEIVDTSETLPKQTFNFSLSMLDPIKIGTNIGFLEITLTGLETGVSNINDFTIFTPLGNFTDITQIYAVHNKFFNDFSSFDTNKLCPIKREEGSGLEVRKWMIDDVFVSTYLPEKCGPANGTIQIAIPNIYSLMNNNNLLTKRFLAENYDLMPGETSLLKEKTEGSISMSMIMDLQAKVGANLDVCTITKFSFTCSSSINQEGFHCVIHAEFTNPGQVYVLASDSESILTTIDSASSPLVSNLIVDPIYTSDSKLTLCGGCTWNDAQICVTQTLNYTIDPVIADPDIKDPDDNNGNEDGPNPAIGVDGKWKLWLRLIVGLGAAALFVLVIVLMWPILTICGKALKVYQVKMQERIKNYGKAVSEEHSKLKDVEINTTDENQESKKAMNAWEEYLLSKKMIN